MIATTGHPFRQGEEARYLGCPRHAAGLSTLEFDAAVDLAIGCPDCVVVIRCDLDARCADPAAGTVGLSERTIAACLRCARGAGVELRPYSKAAAS